MAEELLAYLRQRFDVADLRYRQPLLVIPDGWETNTYRFQVESAAPLPALLGDPLILRAYSSSGGLTRLRHEFDVQQHLGRRGYPVATPVLLEESSWPMGGPFMLMQWVPGEPLLEFLLDHPLSIWSYPGYMAELQAQLNRLPVEDFPRPPGWHLPRNLASLKDIVHEDGFDDMEPGIEWLQAQQPDPPAQQCILHLDFHPLNLMIYEGRFRAVLDWSDADVGDYHADVAATLLLLDAAPVQLTKFRHWLVSLPGQGMLRRRYLRAYRKLLPIDDEKLSYYLAWAAFRRLAVWGHWLHAGPLATGVKPSTTNHLTPKRLRFLANYFHKYSGVSIGLPPSRACRFDLGSSGRHPLLTDFQKSPFAVREER